ncbi:hypothetical protein EYZ11_010536 [Aspergillus tanneri]|uniref:Uncharacterized protein n=1 Tax=Aspergillus tanneri TaxID=1220188 RepID=A0A4S3J796_9EURO|nr:hypothetical protein EYZ11_010536 [Aspergillus tanneri]
MMKRHPNQNDRNRMIPFPTSLPLRTRQEEKKKGKETRHAAYCTKVSYGREVHTHNLRNDSPMGNKERALAGSTGSMRLG